MPAQRPSKVAWTRSVVFRSTAPIRERLAAVPVPAVDDGGDVDVDNVPVPQPVIAGDTVADDLVHAGADAGRVILPAVNVLVAQGGGAVAVLRGVGVGDLVQLAGPRPGDHVRADHVHQARIERPGGFEGGVLVRPVDRGGRALFGRFFLPPLLVAAGRRPGGERAEHDGDGGTKRGGRPRTIGPAADPGNARPPAGRRPPGVRSAPRGALRAAPGGMLSPRRGGRRSRRQPWPAAG